MANDNVVKSNPFNDVEGLLTALKKADQSKQGAFRVSTWCMVIQELINLKASIGEVGQVAEQAVSQKPNLEKLREELEQNMDNRLSEDDASTVLF